MPFPPVQPWPYLPSLSRLALALALGLLVGLERERRGKEAGVRTFAFAALLGCMGGLLTDAFALLSIALLALPVIFLNWHSLRHNQDTEMTTSVALLVTGFAGVLCGKGHTFTPVTVGVVTAGLLAWKQRLAGFSTGLTEEELRSAILLGILTFVIYPVLPARALDPWHLIEPRAAWMTVILVAAIGFGNYVLLKLYGSRGVEMTGFLGGLVNSTVAVTELAARAREGGDTLAAVAYRGVVLSTAAMLVRNAVVLGLLSLPALVRALVPLAVMLVGAAVVVAVSRSAAAEEPDAEGPQLKLTSPFSLRAALEFGLVFLALDVAGTLAQRFLGSGGFLMISAVGGLVSSASAVASAGALAAHGELPARVAAQGAVVASLASALVNVPLVARIARQPSLTRKLTVTLVILLVLGVAALALFPEGLSAARP